MTTIGPDVYTDFNGLAKLRADARADTSESLRAVAAQFEALFVQMMLKSMRAATPEDGMLHSDQGDMYRDMFDQQLAINLAQSKGIGLADMLVNQLGGNAAQATSQAPGAQNDFAQRLFLGEPQPVNTRVAPQMLAQRFAHGMARPLSAPLVPLFPEPTQLPAPIPWESPQGFVQSLWPHAEQAARSLGVQPQVLLAQAALETGWGQSVINFKNGRSSHNLFGIKADAQWQGQRVVVSTLEYVDGIAVKRNDAFRAYDSYADSFHDYVDFLRTNPRYSEALRQGHDPARFAQALQGAGYATDPAYASKIRAILHSPALHDVVAAKDSAH